MSDASPILERYQFDNVVVLKRRTASVEFAEEIYERAFDYPKHEHEKAYFMLTDHCVYKEELGNKTFHHSPNTILWRPPGIAHSDSMARANGRSFSVYIKDGLLQGLPDYAEIPHEFSETNSYLVFLANRLRSEFGNWAEGSALIAEGLVLEILGYAVRKKIPADKTPPGWLGRVIEKLDDEFLASHTNLELANEVGVHPVHLARTFRRYYGRSVGTYLKEKRVQRAIQLIIRNDRSLAEIACSSGFSDQSQLTRAFREIVGITPGIFRHEVTGARR